MFKQIQAPLDAPAFVFTHNDRLLTLTHVSFVNFLRLFLQKGGFNPAAFTGTSFRKGGCVFAMTCKIPLPFIKFHGDWHSQAFERYMALPLVVRRRVTREMDEHITHSRA